MSENEKMRMCLYEAQTADGKTVRLISHFDEKSTDPEATKAVVMPLLQKTPEYAKAENMAAKIRAQSKNGSDAWRLAEKARKYGVCQSNISQIKRGKSWAWLKIPA